MISVTEDPDQRTTTAKPPILRKVESPGNRKTGYSLKTVESDQAEQQKTLNLTKRTLYRHHQHTGTFPKGEV